jgi:hypothetical protein
MDHLFLQPRDISIEENGTIWVPSIHGRQRPDGTWEGWIEFRTANGRTRTTDRETTQPNREALEYWVGGLEPVYYEGAFGRAVPLSA